MSAIKKEKKRAIHIALPSTGEEEWQAVKEPIETGWLTQGPKVSEFEKNFSDLHKVKHSLAVTSCTTALHLAIAALNIGPEDEVIVPSFTWVATANAVLYCGAKPVLCDVDPKTFNIDIDQALSLVTEKTKAIIPVHLFGLCADIDALRTKLPKDIAIIEDAACAAGAIYKGKYAGGLGDIGCFSFHPRKSITCGEGGMVTTNRDDLAALMQTMRNHGAGISEEQRHHGPQPYILPSFEVLGFNYRMTDLQGAIGNTQLAKLVSFINERSEYARWYHEALSGIEWLRLPEEPKDGRHAWQSFVTYVDPNKSPKPRNEIMADLHAMGVATRPGTHAVHMLDYYKNSFGFQPEDFPGAKLCEENSMAIPLHNRMTMEDYEYVAECLKSF